jgi:Fe-S-cluster containining protein
MVVQAWLAAAENADIARELDAIERMIADQVAARGPACWMSGRCCNFDRFDHRLYATGLEVARSMLRLDQAGPALTRESLDAAVARGGCPFQQENRCGQHDARPVGCRVYFCDRSAQDWQHDLAERAHDMVKALHERRGIPYQYAEWRLLLSLFVGSGAAPRAELQA